METRYRTRLGKRPFGAQDGSADRNFYDKRAIMARWEKILMAVDEGETSLRALRYVARIAASKVKVVVCKINLEIDC